MFENIFKHQEQNPIVHPAQEAVKAVLETALKQDVDCTIVNPANDKKVHVVSKNGQLWIDGEKVG